MFLEIFIVSSLNNAHLNHLFTTIDYKLDKTLRLKTSTRSVLPPTLHLQPVVLGVSNQTD